MRVHGETVGQGQGRVEVGAMDVEIRALLVELLRRQGVRETPHDVHERPLPGFEFGAGGLFQYGLRRKPVRAGWSS